ncbi:S-adenosylmethionine transporter [Rhodotorula toruloides]|uniref:S-adenosylmethionine transporter n=1 Tax=Rhodotorula toruloides TaxID=5286 RepID=A0A511KCD5_RHOTO|nr:S-adenosylmethionine transporter [Rhodotorula toruloides]
MDSAEVSLGPVPGTPFTTALVSGGLAGTAVDTLFFPIDTLKTRAQSEQGLFRAGGFSGVYRGLGSAVVGSAPGASLFFTSYELSKEVLPKLFPRLGTTELAPILHMIAASLGEVAACMVRVPTEVVKQRSQTGSKGTRSWDVAKAVWRREGLNGFYRGFGSTVAREIPFTCLQFPLYERLKLLLTRRTLGPSASVTDLPAWQAAACGSVAGGVAAGLTTPLDVAKTRIMLSSSAASTPPPPSLLPTLRRIYAHEGPSALFAGVVPRVLWISMGGSVFLGVYEKAKAVLMSDAERMRSRETD